ncbi:hypothetical protein NDU88_004450 [Pleurodeles waltl]|uniref:Uncharacterized protein n=1 Tax=Pleurodeles waltl TaxID=8319 RepID=A0AAV7RLL8_PLEWA|nr:hypothetical protein NDU88_004450 [Pleurodeles waltl]
MTGDADGLRLAEDSRDRRSLQGGPAQVRRSQRAPAVCTVVRAHGGTRLTSVLLPCINDEVPYQGAARTIFFSHQPVLVVLPNCRPGIPQDYTT